MKAYARGLYGAMEGKALVDASLLVDGERSVQVANTLVYSFLFTQRGLFLFEKRIYVACEDTEATILPNWYMPYY